MDKEIFVKNVQSLCELRGIPPTVACQESGAGRYLLSKLKAQGSVPSVEKVQLLAAYLGVTTSELLGETGPPGQKGRPTPNNRDGPGEISEPESALLGSFRQLNEEGQERLLETADDMVRSGKYIKISEDQVGQEA